MFDVSFSELMVIAVIALIVIGPEKLPKLARTLGALTGRMQKYVAQIKEEVNREVRFEELQQLQQEIKDSVNKAEVNFKLKTSELCKELEGATIDNPLVQNVKLPAFKIEDNYLPDNYLSDTNLQAIKGQEIALEEVDVHHVKIDEKNN